MKTINANSASSAKTLVEITDSNFEEAKSMLNAKWSIREKLYLISFILVHGDTDWPFISSPLNKWITTNHTISATKSPTNGLNNSKASASISHLTNNKKKTIAVSFYSLTVNSGLLTQWAHLKNC